MRVYTGTNPKVKPVKYNPQFDNPNTILAISHYVNGGTNTVT